MVLPLVLASGCNNTTSSPLGLVDCKVSIDGQPAANVRVAMIPTAADDSTIVLEGISDVLGVAHMQLVDDAELPNGDKIDFRVVVESLGDWSVIKPWSDAKKTPLTVTWDRSGAEAAALQVEIPKKAIKPL